MKFWMDMAGWFGAAFFLVSYGLLITKKWKSDQSRYHITNLIGAILLCINTWYDASFPSVIINGVWGTIALYGLSRDRTSSRLTKKV